MTRGRLGWLIGALALAGCLDDWQLDQRTFPCRQPGDCIAGFGCHPERYVCVPASELPPDAGVTDANAGDAGISDAAGGRD